MRSLAILIALGMALALGACGRKAGLDSPPSASFAAPNGRAQANSANSLRPQAVSNPSSGATSAAPSDERPASQDSSDPRFAAGTQPRQKSFFLDWLIR